jgi:glutathione S-transferase
MALREEDVQRIGEYVKPWIDESVRSAVRELGTERWVQIDTPLLERMVRVEEELKSQRELMTVRFEAIDQRFADQRELMDERFTAMDRRFEDQRQFIDERFRAMDRRFEDQRLSIDARFEETRARDRRSDWFMGIGFTIVTVAVTLVGVLL